MKKLLSHNQIIDRVLSHIDNRTTDLGAEVLRVPTRNYVNQSRFEAEMALIKRSPVPFCPTAMLADKGSYVARKAVGTPIVVVRGRDGEIRAFINAWIRWQTTGHG